MNSRGVFAACAVLAAVSASRAGDGKEGSFGKPEADGVTPVMVSLFTPTELPNEKASWDVRGLRLDLLYGRCRKMTGLDLGIVAQSDSFHGLQIAAVNITDSDVRMTMTVGGLVNMVGKSYTGFQLGGLVNVVEDDLNALQVAGVVNYAGGSLKGLQCGLVNISEQMKNAWQVGFWNTTGTANHSGQVGIFNIVGEADVVFQLGLINIIENNEFPCIPFVNCRF